MKFCKKHYETLSHTGGHIPGTVEWISLKFKLDLNSMVMKNLWKFQRGRSGRSKVIELTYRRTKWWHIDLKKPQNLAFITIPAFFKAIWLYFGIYNQRAEGCSEMYYQQWENEPINMSPPHRKIKREKKKRFFLDATWFIRPLPILCCFCSMCW